MKQKNNSKPEKVFSQAMRLWENGKSAKEILDMFPARQKELQKLLKVVEILEREKLKIIPKRKILNKILSQLEIARPIKAGKNYRYREKTKGRLSILQLAEIKKILNLMTKKDYLLAGAAVLIIIIIGIYWYSQRPELAVLPDQQELAYETESLSQDISDLEIIAMDKSLETLDEDLLALAEETSLEKELSLIPAVDLGEIEGLESELSAELDGIANDLTDLKELEEDTSLDNLDTSLSALSG